MPAGEFGSVRSTLKSQRRHPRLLDAQDVDAGVLGKPEKSSELLADQRGRVQRPDHAAIGLPTPRLLPPAGVGPRRRSGAAPFQVQAEGNGENAVPSESAPPLGGPFSRLRRDLLLGVVGTVEPSVIVPVTVVGLSLPSGASILLFFPIVSPGGASEVAIVSSFAAR